MVARGMVVFLICTSWSTSVVAEETAQNTLQVVIQDLLNNEKRYRNLEVEWSKEYSLETPKYPNPRAVVSELVVGRSIEQEEKYFLNYEGVQTLSDGDRPIHRRKAFDGETTLYLQQRGVYIGNVIEGRAPNNKLFRPHTIPLRRFWISVPLSTWIEGPAAVRKHPDKGNSIDRTTATYIGRETIKDLLCEHIRVDYLMKGEAEKVTDQRHFWLAVDRNYLPVRATAYNLYYSRDLPIEVTEMKDLREIEPGTWFPFEIDHVVSDMNYLKEDAKVVPSWRDQYLVTRVSLHPNYDLAFFRDVVFPDGTPVYYLSKNGKILSSERVGSRTP